MYKCKIRNKQARISVWRVFSPFIGTRVCGGRGDERLSSEAGNVLSRSPLTGRETKSHEHDQNNNNNDDAFYMMYILIWYFMLHY